MSFSSQATNILQHTSKYFSHIVSSHLHLYSLSFCHSEIFCPFDSSLSRSSSTKLIPPAPHLASSCLLQVNSAPSLGSLEDSFIPDRLYCIAGETSATYWRVQQVSYLGPVFYLMDGKLHRNVEAVQDVASKHQCVLRSVDSMNPPLSKSTNYI